MTNSGFISFNGTTRFSLDSTMKNGVSFIKLNRSILRAALQLLHLKLLKELKEFCDLAKKL